MRRQFLAGVALLGLLLLLAACGGRSEPNAGQFSPSPPAPEATTCWPIATVPPPARLLRSDVIIDDRRRMVWQFFEGDAASVEAGLAAGLRTAGFTRHGSGGWSRRDVGLLRLSVADLPGRVGSVPVRGTVRLDLPASTWSFRDPHGCATPTRAP